ncbi:TolC family protein [Gimesia sp.]|uniref:TolC family protein n=1 Tax=Gimesia sp. TaxID=2024833 RepID=UPI0025C52216|nr:TolC family protein [Gimesia sp.]
MPASISRKVLLLLMILGRSCVPQLLFAQGAFPFVPPAAKPQNAGASEDQVGRRFIPPMSFPQSPAGVESLMKQETPQPSETDLSLDALLMMATENNPTLVQAQHQIQGTLGKALEAGLYPNPTFYYIAEQIFVDSSTDTDTPGEFQGGAIQQEIVTANKRAISRRKYQQRAKTAEWMAVTQQWRVCNDVRIHFWKTLGHRQIVDIRRELLKAAEDSALTTRERFNQGQATQAELHLSNVSLQRTRLSLLNAENMYRSQFAMLSSLVGVELEPQPLKGELAEDMESMIDFNQAVENLYTDSPEVLAATAKWQADCITLERERVEPVPNIFVKAATGYNHESREPVASVQVFMEVPIFDRNQGTIKQAEADLARQNAEIRRTKLRLRQNLALHYQKYLTALQHVIEFKSVILPEAKAAYANQLDAYKENRQNWGEVLKTQREYYQLREHYVHQLIAWRSNETLINGFLLHGGLKAAESPTPPGHIDSVAQPR